MRLRQSLIWALWFLVPCLWVLPVWAADDKVDEKLDAKEPADVVQQRGLKKSTTNYVLPGETDFNKLFKDARTLQRKVFDASKQLEKANALETERRATIVQLLQERRKMRGMLQNTRDGAALNRLIDLMEEAEDRIRILEEGAEVKQALSEAEARASNARDAYTEHLLKMRRLADEISEKYEDLAADPALKSALEKLNAGLDKPLALGPSAPFKRNLLNLKKLEDVVLAETIKLRRDEADMYYVQVVFDDRYSKEMGIDTGASLIALPYKMAVDVGLEPKENDPEIMLELADGRPIPAKLVVAKSVRVGKFVVENVECAVFPEGLPKATALLGMTFLRNFSYKINNEDSTLLLSKIESPGGKKAREKEREDLEREADKADGDKPNEPGN
ncbi:MAG: TIGR02281 family clan AA aspartic protease [Pirellulales bacterium]|nr:TIGR02281 family clan AA aspartic protease [Pirellulales bacterium]